MANVPIPVGVKPQPPSHHPLPEPKPVGPPRSGDGPGPLNPYEMWGPGNEWGYSDAIPGSQPVSQGWDATRGKLGPIRRAAAVNQSNAILTDGKSGFQMSIFVSNMAIDSALAGSTAQSQLVRDFYAHNFVQPDIVVTGWSLDQEDYGLLCEFIHSCQHKAITSNSSKWPDFMTQLIVFGRDGMGGKAGTRRGVDGNRDYGKKVSVTGSQPYFNQTIRGSHKSAVAKGYVASMPREHRHFQNAVQWQFSFTVAAMIEGLYAEKGISVQVRQTWKDILADAKEVGVSTVTASENKASLAYAATNAATLTGQIPSGATPGGSGGSVPTGGGAGEPKTINRLLPASNYTTRPNGENSIKIIILHSTESDNTPGSTHDLDSLYEGFLADGLSIHIGLNGDGVSMRMVDDVNQAYQAFQYSAGAVGIEQIGHASQSSWPSAQTDAAAQWISYWCKRYNIPFVHSTTHGICRHMDLDQSMDPGGNQTDPGVGYPLDQVIAKAQSL